LTYQQKPCAVNATFNVCAKSNTIILTRYEHKLSHTRGCRLIFKTRSSVLTTVGNVS